MLVLWTDIGFFRAPPLPSLGHTFSYEPKRRLGVFLEKYYLSAGKTVSGAISGKSVRSSSMRRKQESTSRPACFPRSIAGEMGVRDASFVVAMLLLEPAETQSQRAF